MTTEWSRLRLVHDESPLAPTQPEAGFPAAAVALGFALIGSLLVLFGIAIGFVIGHWLV